VANTHYDIIILGESLASRIAAVLLARAGRRVLTVGPAASTPPCPAWIPVSPHLERLLELLSGRSCLVTAPPFQVLSGPVRLTLHGNTAQLDELRREFPADSARVQTLFDELAEIGNRLETALWESGGLPLTGWASRWRFFYQRLHQGLPRARLLRPLASRLQTGSSAQTTQALAALFSGLSLCPIEDLTVAEGALLWRGFGDSRGISTVALNTLLTHRFEQFQGEQIRLDEVQTLQTVNGRPHELVLNNGRHCTAPQFLLGDRAAGSLLSVELRAGEATAAPSPLHARVTDGAISPLFAQIIILDGSPPLRLTLTSDSATSHSRILCQAAAPPNDRADDQHQERLAALFPFATLRFDPPAEVANCPVDQPQRQRSFPGAVRSLVAKENLLCCCGGQVLPTLGAIGEILVGVSVANHLQRQKRP
jgi:hypothetical protein